jgi:catechol 2,3-dioxygenase-like lactoylglutathione lyase family enzyme
VPLGVSRVFHCNVNCSDLDRSLAFYGDLLGLTPGVRTAPTAPQPGGAFGLDTAQWDARILSGETGYDGVALDLLEWQVPPPSGTPYAPANHVGFTRLGLVTRNVDAAYERLSAAGVDCFGPPHDIGLEGAPTVRAFVCADPDGTLVELVSGNSERIAFLAIGCTELARSSEFYVDLLGFKELARFAPDPHDGAGLRIDGDVEWEMAYLDDGSGQFAIDLTQWKRPAPAVPAYPSANNLGIFRMALITTDIDADYAELERRGIACVSPPATLDMGPGLPELRALLFPDPDGAMVELIEAPTV